MQFFGIEEIIKPLTKTSATIVEWEAGSKLRIGGQGYNITSTLTLDTATDIDAGAVASATLYYVYAVVSSGQVSLVASISSLKPSIYNAYRKVGAFWNNSNDVISDNGVWSYGEDFYWDIRAKITNSTNPNYTSTDPNFTSIQNSGFTLTPISGESAAASSDGNNLGETSGGANGLAGLIFDAPLSGSYKITFNFNWQQGGTSGSDFYNSFKIASANPNGIVLSEGNNIVVSYRDPYALGPNGTEQTAYTIQPSDLFELNSGKQSAILLKKSTIGQALDINQNYLYLNESRPSRMMYVEIKSENAKFDWT